MAHSPERLKAAIGAGLLSFPVTHFTDDGAFAPRPYQEHIDHLVGHRPAAVFAAGGTGEFFSLQSAEYESVIAAAVESAGGRLPVVAGVGYGTALAIEFARRAEKVGADGILLLPQYLIQAEQEGLYRHIAAICRAVSIGVVVYHRDNCLFELDTIRRLADQCPNLIGFKDGHGNVELLTCLRETLGDRLVYIGGMPTAEIFAAANRAIGVSTYSSAIFNFIPEFAQRFYAAIHSDDYGFAHEAVRSFFIPYLALRNQRRGYAVSIIKAGLRVVGRPAGPVRAPLLDLSADQEATLAELVARATRALKTPARPAIRAQENA
ncbi:MAG TPA: 5-dehydro-4-deoxyglucarate dehydratase [Roseiarcus sp.]|nr:5-dehydro-4-deoxyglucarate dehydratase [Roseiarcus sp.]